MSKHDKKAFRIRSLFLVALFATLLITGVQIYFLTQQYSHTNKLTLIALNESLSQAINEYQLDLLKNRESDSISHFKIGVNGSTTHNKESLSFIQDNIFGQTEINDSANFIKIDYGDIIVDSRDGQKDHSVRPLLQSNASKKTKDTVTRTINTQYTIKDTNRYEMMDFLNPILLLTSEALAKNLINVFDIDRIYNRILAEKGLYIRHSIQLIDAINNQIIEDTDPSLSENRHKEDFTKRVSLNKLVRIYFKNPYLLVLKQMYGMILTAALMLLFTVCCLFYYLKIISRQKKIETIREDFVHSMTHELRNPLQSAMVLSEMLADEKIRSNPPMYNDIVERIQNNLNALKEQTNSLLTLALSEKQHAELIKEEHILDEMLEDIVNTYKIIASKPIRFHLKVTPSPTVALYNKIHLPNAIRNLIENAIKYSGEEVEIAIEANQMREKLLIHVKDNGIGIAEEDLPHIFKQYYRSSSPNGKSNISGFGLGLSYVKWVVEAHNGTIKAKSKKGEGSTFTIEIPL